jgi:hypothetical protein
MARIRTLDRLKDLEALKLGMAEIKRLVGAGVAVGGVKASLLAQTVCDE